MHTVSLTDFELENNEMRWKLNNVSFKIKYLFDIENRFINTFKLIPIIQACCLASTYKDSVSIESDIPIKSSMIQFISEYAKMQYVFNMEQLDIKIEKDTPDTHIKFPKDRFLDEQLNPSSKKVVSSWSGGKDSYLTIKLLTECKLKVIPATTKWNTIAFNRGANPFLNSHAEIKPNIIASISVGNKMKKIFKYALEEQNIFIENKKSGTFSDKKELPMILYHSFYMNTQIINNILYALHKKISCVFMGDEADVNDVKKYCGFKHHLNIGQGFKNKTLINNFLTSTYGKHATQVHSILYPIHGPLEVKLLIERYNTANFSSCLTMIEKACSKCPKCLVTYLTCKSLGYDPAILGINEKKLIQNFKWQLGESFLMPEEETVYWYIRNCIDDPTTGPIVGELLDSTPSNIEFNPLVPLKNKYKTIPRFIRKKITKIYNEYI